MNEKTFKTLEYYKIKEKLSDFCVSQLGRELAQQLLPSASFNEIQQLLTETGEAEAILFRRGNSPIEPFDDIRAGTARVKVGATLSMNELLRAARFMKVSRNTLTALTKTDNSENVISAIASAITPTREIEEEIFRCILSEDELTDTASPALASIRRQIRSCNDSIKEKLNSYLKKSDLQKYLQEAIITVRGGRYVLPVKNEYRVNVPGIVHDQSSTGATLFIEPIAVVEINNNLRILYSQERDEIERILSELSASVGSVYDVLITNLQIMQKLDFTFAKAKLSREMNAVTPKMNQRGYLNIKKGRHPLIDKKQVVPIDVWLGDQFTVLLITGPNTGGKTVTLKTVGLFSLMAQSGLNVPADIGTELTVFDSIFADIGDEQSIEQSLSTFSSHMTNIAKIMREVTRNALVLFDELGAGTDPNEGAALAMSILEELRLSGTRCVATTHYSELKAYSMNTSGIENASVEFDIVSLKPTYKLSVGIPGMSNAFLISERLGLDKRLITRAGEFMSGSQLRFENVLKQAQEHKKAAEAENEAAQAIRRETERLKIETKQMQQQLDKQKDEILAKARQEAKKVLENANNQVNEYIEEMKQLKEGRNDENLIKMQTKRKAMDKLLHGDAPQKETVITNIDKKDIKVGQTVFAHNLDQNVIVQSLPNAKGEIRVQAGILQMDIDIKNISFIDEQVRQKSATSHVQRSGAAVPLSLDIRGKLVDEAEIYMDRYLEDAYMANYHEVTIIHGKGTGALRNGVAAFLKKHYRVKSFRAGKYGEGDSGVTVVELK